MTLSGLLLLLLAVQDPWPILDKASQAYQTARTLSADFVQIVDNPLIGGPDTTRGKLFQSRPNYFAMRFTQPQGDRIVADGRRMWLYTPSTTPGQVIRTAIPGTGTTGPNLIGQFVERPRERYTARYQRSDSLPDGVVDVIGLVPRAPAPELPYSEAVVWIGRKDGLVRRIDIVETSGQRRTIILQNLAVNRGVPSREFRFSPPAGSRVVDQ
ncbi:MAG TPA: outer membrane lipoprotein chaperone LolA [Gemmatimonadales bacterium]|nr:outer membrane lipoprotein chaperone LolA [Gemmatimonadales bacterium]